jgi:hypothetical protein
MGGFDWFMAAVLIAFNLTGMLIHENALVAMSFCMLLAHLTHAICKTIKEKR